MKRPLGVKAFGVLLIGMSLISLWQILVDPKVFNVFNSGPMLDAPIALRRSVPLAIGGFSLFLVVVGVGLLFMKAWARLGMLWMAGFMTLEGLMFMILPFLASSALVFWYFLRPGVKAQFVSKTTNR